MRHPRVLDTDGVTGTLAGDVFADLRQKIISGTLAPGSRLSPAHLAAEYGVSSTVVREALTRLAAERLAQSSPQQGYSVSAASKEELIDLAKVRMLIDAEGLRASIRRNDLAWKGALVAAHYMLTHIVDEADNPDEATVAKHIEIHRAFHAALIAGCGSPRLIALSEQLYNETEAYRGYLRSIYPQSVMRSSKEHDDIVAATLAGDEARATALLVGHFQSSIDELVDSGLLDRHPASKRPGRDIAAVSVGDGEPPRRRTGPMPKPVSARRRSSAEK